MMRRREFIAMLSAGSAVPLAGCDMLFASRYRFKMTVEVDTPQGMRRGSSVMEVSCTKQLIKLPEGLALKTRLTGEAVAVDLPGGRALFALIGRLPNAGDALAGAVTLAFEPGYAGPDSFLAAVKKLGRQDQLGRKAVLPRDKYPMLVTFRDLNDPRTVEAVDRDNPGAMFGLVLEVKNIYLQTTDLDVTRSIDRKLKWLSDHRGSLDFTGYLHEDKPEKDLTSRDFRLGF